MNAHVKCFLHNRNLFVELPSISELIIAIRRKLPAKEINIDLLYMERFNTRSQKTS